MYQTIYGPWTSNSYVTLHEIPNPASAIIGCLGRYRHSSLSLLFPGALASKPSTPSFLRAFVETLELRRLGIFSPSSSFGAKVLQLATEMDDEGLTKEFFLNRIEQLEHERDELRKDIEQLCMQQAGPSYLAVATRMHFQRTAGLEQEIEILKKKLAGCLREKQNLQEELSEAYRIKTQLADLHNAEVLKNKELEEQMKFFQGSVAAAFSERDHSLMESEKARELEEAMLQKLKTSERRVEELELSYNSENERNVALEKELVEVKEQLESFEKVINKFYGIRERDAGPSADHTWQSRCSCLLDDSLDKWIFNSSSRSTTLTYISSLEEEIESRKRGIEQLQNNMRMGLQIEQHLKRSVRSLGKKQVQLIEMFESRLSFLHHIHNQHRADVVKLLEEEMSHMKAALLEVHEKLRLVHMNIEPKHETFQAEAEHLSDDNECKDVHISNDIDSILSFKETDIPSSVLESRNSDASETLSQALQEKETDIPSSSVLDSRNSDASETFSQALQEKVAALLLLSQQEERHLLERETNVALQHKMEELQKNLAQVANEKIEALMELAQLKCEYQILRDHAMKCGDLSAETIGASISLREREGMLTNLLKKTSLKRWIGKDFVAHDTNVKVTNESNLRASENYSINFARMKVENAALQESISNMEHLTSSIHRLHVSLLKIRDVAVSTGFSESTIESLICIIAEANQVKTAFGSSLPVSWSGDPTVDAITYENLWEPVGSSEDRRSDRVVFSAGLEMVELLILATQLLRNTDSTTCTS